MLLVDFLLGGYFLCLTPRSGKLRVFRLGNGVLLSGIDMSTLISVERCPRYLFKDLNPLRPVITLYLLNVTRWTHTLDY